ncbi:hypothetical protein GYMLUDRAFT_39204 [Collybiopsis luxurians FD-317 M1]|nr:hypothetical protein GYMLUDRAFT_39204 [Collybiopsis luxurians FD-317 M1]
MAPPIEEDWSDSDSDVGSEVETSVLLGVPDGPITSATELADAAVSRIGGHPVRVVFTHVYPKCNVLTFALYTLNKGFSPRDRTSHFFLPMQKLFFSYGTIGSIVVPVRGQSHGSRLVRMGLRKSWLSA